MSRRMLFALWGVIAWFAPAAIAGALGWHGIWGSGSAFVDLLIPIPVAGGVLHIPSFIVVSLILVSQPWSSRIAGYVRGVLFAGALIGVAILLDLNKLQLAAATDAALARWPWQENPVGLCVLTDCLIAQVFLGAFRGRGPDGAKEWSVSLLLAIVVPVLYAAGSSQADPRQREPFMYTRSMHGPGRTDEAMLFYSRLPIGTEEFRQAARPLIRDRDPRRALNVEDAALLFFDSLDAAQQARLDEVRQTLCLYEDGTPMAWFQGHADCFAGHESFSDRMAKTLEAQDKSLPIDVRVHLARRDACSGRRPLVMEPGMYDDNDETRACRQIDAGRKEVLAKHGADPRVAALLAPP